MGGGRGGGDLKCALSPAKKFLVATTVAVVIRSGVSSCLRNFQCFKPVCIHQKNS